MSNTRRLAGRYVPILVVVALIVGLCAWYFGRSSGYTVKLVFPAATNLGTGGLVEEQGFTVGHVKHLSVNNGQAIVEVSVSGADAPLHTGTSAAIDYKSLLGERYVELTPGPKSNPVVPKGGLITNGNGNIVPRVELQSILNQLDPKTRSQLAALIPQFQEVFAGANTTNTQATLQAAEPAVKALSQVLDAVGADGQTLHQLVTDMANLSTRLVNKQASLVSTVSGLDQSMDAIASETSSLSAGISELPATLTSAQTTLSMVPQTTADALPLLSDLHTATNELPAFSSKLEPVLSKLQPVSAELVPTLNGLSDLLRYTPDLLDTANQVVPTATRAVTGLEPAIANLRPYSPELAGFLTDWGAWLNTYNSTGHLVPVPPVIGGTSDDITLPGGLNIDQSIKTAGLEQNNSRQPGQLTTTDAAGNPVQ